jgi:NAD(P)-dependent dehydrogenase (short-subunit alcohol dehydrogenase family)
MSTAIVPGRFEGRTAVVTGAGSGIGKATTLRLLAEGATVVASDISAPRLEELAAEVGSDRLKTVAGDVAAPDTIEAILAAAGGVVDALANNAGIMDAFLPVAELTDEMWDRVMGVNVTGPMRLTRAVLPGMIERGKGTIVNTASEAGIRASAAGTAYTASKHAVVGLTKSTAFFYGPKGIRTNAVAPGAVMTNIEAPFQSEYAAGRVGPIMQTTIPAPAQPEELAASITWLLSDDSSNVNGAILMSDGGWSAV